MITLLRFQFFALEKQEPDQKMGPVAGYLFRISFFFLPRLTTWQRTGGGELWCHLTRTACTVGGGTLVAEGERWTLEENGLT